MSGMRGELVLLAALALSIGCATNASPTTVTIHSPGQRQSSADGAPSGDGSLAEVRDSVAALHDKVAELCEHLATLERQATEDETVSDQVERTCRHMPRPDNANVPATFDEPVAAVPLADARQPPEFKTPRDARAILENGIAAQKQALAVIANNLANASTTGFKRERVNFEDLHYRREVLPGALDSAGQITAVGVAVGSGSRVSSVQTDFIQGDLQHTGRQFDVAIAGRGFFQMKGTGEQVLYTRAGNFSVNANGQLVLGSATTGRVLDPAITIPQDCVKFVIDAEGSVQVQQANNPQLQSAGQLQLALFLNEEGLGKAGENLFEQTDASGAPQQTNPGQNGVGLLRQNMLEASNVDTETERHAWHAARERLRELRRLLDDEL